MKRILALILALTMLLALAACGGGKGSEGTGQTQTATNTYRLHGQETVVSVDLSGGWSVEFATGAVYLYDGPNDGERDPVAFGYVITQEEYEEIIAEYSSYDSFSEVGAGVMFDEGEGGCNKFAFAVGNGLSFLIAAEHGHDENAIYSRFTVTAGDPYEEEVASGIDYMALVNKLHPLPDGWEDALEIVHMNNSLGDDVEVEKKAYDAYLRLKDDLAAEGVYVDLDSARRSIAAQQDIMDRFIEKYGADYAAKTVATPGYSEHHTGLALDLYLNIDGEDVYLNEDMVQHPEIWAKIHEKLPEYGFILRYLEDKEHITGYGYEPWHIRYIDDPDTARDIMSRGITLEEYLGAVKSADVTVDYGTSALYSEEELKEAAVQIKCQFASWAGCELHSLRYAGDECNSEENLKWMNELGQPEDGKKYVQCVDFLMDFHSPTEDAYLRDTAWEPDLEYTDYHWWLARTEDGGWDVLSSGY